MDHKDLCSGGKELVLVGLAVAVFVIGYIIQFVVNQTEIFWRAGVFRQVLVGFNRIVCVVCRIDDTVGVLGAVGNSLRRTNGIVSARPVG